VIGSFVLAIPLVVGTVSAAEPVRHERSEAEAEILWQFETGG
jgi:hypothetical protein